MLAPILLVLGLHAVVIVAIVAIGGRLGRGVFALGAVAPLVATVYGAVQIGADDPVVAEWWWVEGLDLSFRFRIDALASMMTLLVSGIGALVFTYAAGYFSAGAKGLARFAATLLAFSGAMLGLVWADSVWTLFIFWELTSITSFLLVGHKHASVPAQLAARRALVITVAGGLALLAAFVAFVDTSGSAGLSDLSPVEGGAGTAAAVLIMIAAATKSAQVPFHIWLPGAMAAPTPVSAYLHSATMVKAGVLLVAVAAPAMSGVAIWKPLGLTFGLVSMIWGAVGALRHVDAKLILAWGTVSQLGLMITMLSAGSAKATFAGISLLFAHAIFKAALFMIVGEVDVRTGTRSIHELGGLWRSMPMACAVAVVSGASMAGVPPLLGFAAKEAAVEAVLTLDGGSASIVAVAVIGGSILTVAYTVRFLVGVFGPGPIATVVKPARPLMSAPAAVLGLGSIVGYVAMGWVNDLVRPAAVEINEKAEVYSLLRWPGLTEAFGYSVGIVAAGILVGGLAARRTSEGPEAVGAAVVDDGIDGTIALARQTAAQIQHGSLPVYVATMAATASLATLPFLWALDPDVLYRWDRPAQGALAVAVVLAALATLRVDSRLGAALALGSVGVGVSGLFVVHGAPDLVLTQLLVETVVVVGFVMGLGHLARSFPPVGAIWRSTRIVVSLMVGGAVAVGLAASASRPTGAPPLEALTEGAVDEGGGNNVVNVILTDVRALDTVGEIVVLAVVAIGVLALARAGRDDTDDAGSARLENAEVAS